MLQCKNIFQSSCPKSLANDNSEMREAWKAPICKFTKLRSSNFLGYSIISKVLQ